MKVPVKKKFPSDTKSHDKLKFDDNYKRVYYTVALFFTGAFLSVTFGFKTILPIVSLVKMMALILVCGYLVQRFFFSSVWPMKNMEYFMFSAVGITPVATAFVLILNFYWHTEEKKDFYTIDKVLSDGNYRYYFAQGLPCEEYPELCRVHWEDADVRKGMTVEITLAKGIAGYWIIEEINLTAK